MQNLLHLKKIGGFSLNAARFVSRLRQFTEGKNEKRYCQKCDLNFNSGKCPIIRGKMISTIFTVAVEKVQIMPHTCSKIISIVKNLIIPSKIFAYQLDS